MNELHCLDYLALLQMLPDKSIDVLISDPPYGTTAIEWDQPIDWLAFWKEAKRVTKGYVVLFSAQPFTTDLINSNRAGFNYEDIWFKGRGVDFLRANLRPMRSHENILVFEKGTYNPQFNYDKPYKKTQKSKPSKLTRNHATLKLTDHDNPDGKRYPLSVIHIVKERNLLHPTQKPLDLMQYLVRTYSNAGDVILDPFCGSGSTLVAARNEQRNYIGGDTSEEYLTIAKKRLEEPFTMRLL